MEILSHRGYWISPEEKNTLAAFERSLNNNFGLETDIRDYMGELVISHDIADSNCLKAKTLFSLYADLNSKAPLALNIKSDGLQNKIKSLFSYYSIDNYFVFDMSIPDAITYERNGIIFFTRESEYETDLPLYDSAAGIWLDCFENEWYNNKDICRHLSNNKRVCIVSPELHRRPKASLWQELTELSSTQKKDLMLCTDFPEEAQEFFNGKN